MRSLRFNRLLPATLVGLAGLATWAGTQPATLRGQNSAALRRSIVEAWEPAYTGYLRLPGEDIAVTLADDSTAGRMWLAGDTWVSAIADGVWTVPETPPEVSVIFALAPAGDDMWAFGLDGGAWRRHAGRWAAVPAPLTADMYAAAGRAETGEAWAVGFDYAGEQGVIFHAVGQGDQASIVASTFPWLKYTELRAVAIDPLGRLWIGGCDYTAQSGKRSPLLMLARSDTDWQAVPVPLEEGCVYDLSFNGLGPPAAGDGWGLAAAGTDLLWWRPGDRGADDRWHASGQAPPAGYQWVRAAATASGGPSASAGDPLDPTGWAIAGAPVWNGYRDAQPPWFYDGDAWRVARVDYLGLGDPSTAADGGELHPFLSLASDGSRAWSVSRVKGAVGIAPDARALLMSLDAGTARLAHPLLAQASDGDLAAAHDRVVAGTGQGGAPFLQHDAGGWHLAGEGVFVPGERLTVGRIDLAADGTGWALGTLRPLDGAAAVRRAAWRLDGTGWHATDPPPAARPPVQLRALPGGQAWSLARATDSSGRLWASDGNRWALLDGAPTVQPPPTATPPVPAPLLVANHGAVRAPFDAAGPRAERVGWLAPAELGLVRYAGGTFTPDQAGTRGQVIDLQLIGPRAGWAIGVDSKRVGTNPGITSGVLLRLQDGAWHEVTARLVDATGRPVGLGRAAANVHWLLLAAVSADEAWLYGYIETERQAFRALVGYGRGRTAVVIPCYSNVLAMSALPINDDNGRQLGTDVWLLGEGPCGTPADPRLSPRMPGGASLNPAYLPNHAGPVARVRVRYAADQVFLPDTRVAR